MIIRKRKHPDNFIHGMTKGSNGNIKEASEYTAYRNAKARCLNPKFPHFSYYGGRGIEFRFDSFKEFFSYVGLKPSPQHSLDRIDNDGHYEKGNVRWATGKEQAANRRCNKCEILLARIKELESQIFNCSKEIGIMV